MLSRGPTPGWTAPLTRGDDASASSMAASSAAGSAPILERIGRTIPSAWSSSALSRCSGSTAAASPSLAIPAAASSASCALIVSLSSLMSPHLLWRLRRHRSFDADRRHLFTLQAGCVRFLNRRDHTQATAYQPGPPRTSPLVRPSSQRTTCERGSVGFASSGVMIPVRSAERPLPAPRGRAPPEPPGGAPSRARCEPMPPRGAQAQARSQVRPACARSRAGAR